MHLSHTLLESFLVTAYPRFRRPRQVYPELVKLSLGLLFVDWCQRVSTRLRGLYCKGLNICSISTQALAGAGLARLGSAGLLIVTDKAAEDFGGSGLLRQLKAARGRVLLGEDQAVGHSGSYIIHYD